MIRLENVHFQYGDENENNGALHDINLEIPSGQAVLFCGESGCGKTTITRLINGLIPHFYEGRLTGKIRVDGQEIQSQELYDTAKIVGTVFQNPRSQFFNVDTRSEVAFGLENQGIREAEILKRVNQTVTEFQMESLMDRSIFELSGGEKQKIACACVSTSSPEVFVLDEPSANLDAHSMKLLHNMILRWKQQGKTIVIAEHRLAYIWNLIDRVIFLESGKIAKDMQPAEFLKLSETELHSMGLRSNNEQKISKMHKATDIKNIEFKDITFGYKKGKQILDISKIQIPEHEITAIIGHNGLGKSTFLRCICGLEKKCKTRMIKNGAMIKRKKCLAECFLVMQDVNHQLFTESVLDEVLISMEQEDKEKAQEILAELDLLEYAGRHPISLSGGQKQRVAVATAIASERDILLFDEPTSGLDYKHMLQVSAIFQKLKAKGKTIIVVTHDMEFIEAISANIIELNTNSVKNYAQKEFREEVDCNEKEKLPAEVI
ncbi:ABC transporter ATP-binding protein [Murimonas intestini]|uniref:ABC transporter ATP-binding protein n=1 Tax=Murimonas intestini TaxID=1337051 RepID=UPI0011DDFF49|nr:ABC transporter ATP-binding protein [Murimonas intestini]